MNFISDGKGEKDSITILPESLTSKIKKQIEKIRYIHKIEIIKF